MRREGKPLVKLPSAGRSMIYGMAGGQTVRLRTCNDHVLIIVADSPDNNARLNIEGTDWLLVVMPEVERTPGKTLSYLLPTSIVETEARKTHAEWLASNPNTRGENRTWNLWFGEEAPSKAKGYAQHWAKYRLALSSTIKSGQSDVRAPSENFRSEIERARQGIAELAGVPVEAVKITINFES